MPVRTLRSLRDLGLSSAVPSPNITDNRRGPEDCAELRRGNQHRVHDPRSRLFGFELFYEVERIIGRLFLVHRWIGGTELNLAWILNARPV
jgi:hypothetical protein